VLAGIKGVLRQEVPAGAGGEGAAGGGGEKTPLGERLRELGADDYVGVMRRLYRVLLLILQRCANVHALLCAVIRAESEDGGGEDGRSAELQGASGDAGGAAQRTAACVEVLDHLCDTGHQRCGRLLAVRERQTVHLSLSEFSALFDATVEFANATDRVCGRQRRQTLRATLLAQAKGFLEALHVSNAGKLSTLLDQEQWKQVSALSRLLLHACA